MPSHAFATADTIPAATPREQARRRSLAEDARELISAAQALRERLRLGPDWIGSPSEIVREVASRVASVGVHGKAQEQHAYQKVSVTPQRALSPAEWTAATLAAGWYRLELEVPARLRLWRWRARRAVLSASVARVPVLLSPRTERLVRRALPLLVVLGATVACSLVSQDGGGQPLGTSRAWGPVPELSKKKVAAAAPTKVLRKTPWHYVLAVDHGVRADDSGEGHFRAPRFHGEHNGLDLLAPVGTPVFSPCDGQATAGLSGSFGHWVHIICPVPEGYVQAGAPSPWVSFFYAHLDKSDFGDAKWVDVAGGQAVGQVGKSGNARGPHVQPHLHMELIVQKNRRSAMDERHLGSDQSTVAAADYFAETLSSDCMAPRGFSPKSQLLRRARRIDPFVALTCLSNAKPNFVRAPAPLTQSSLAWTQFYVAKDFNVNLGLTAPRMATR